MSLTESWSALFAWCEQNAPITASAIRPPASTVDLEATRALFPRPWPDELVEWFGVQDGIEESPFPGVGPLPGWTPISLAQVREAAKDLGDIADELDFSELVADGERERAGSQTPVWLPSFVPLARDVATDFLVVDTRPGPRHGGLLEWSPEDGTRAGPRPTLTKLVEGTARSVARGKPLNGLVPEVLEGALTWGDADHPARKSPPALPTEWQGFYTRLQAYRIDCWDDGGPDSQAATHAEWEAWQSRAQLVDGVYAILFRREDDWNGGLESHMESNGSHLRKLLPHLTSDLAKLRADQTLELLQELRDLQRVHPL